MLVPFLQILSAPIIPSACNPETSLGCQCKPPPAAPEARSPKTTAKCHRSAGHGTSNHQSPPAGWCWTWVPISGEVHLARYISFQPRWLAKGLGQLILRVGRTMEPVNCSRKSYVSRTWSFFHTCQVRVVRFYVSVPPLPPPPSPPPCPPDLNCKLLIAVVPARPEEQPQDQSEPRRTSTASSWSQWSPPDPNSNFWIKVIESPKIPDRMPEGMPERMSECQIESQSICHKKCQIYSDIVR